MPYGPVYTSESLKQQLKNANRDYYGRKTWQDLYGNISLAEQQSLSALKEDYTSAIGEAYTSSLKNEQNILSSNLAEGYKTEALIANENALEEAFMSYKQNYLSNVAEIESNTAKANQQVTSALETEANYTKLMAEAPYQYLQYMYENYGDTELFNEQLWKRYLNETPILNEKGEQQYDEQGNPLYDKSLKSWEEIVNLGARDEKTGEWIGLFDASGNLTIKGQDFYDQMMNQMSYEGRNESFWSWLNKENEELYNWSQSYNPYDYTEQGSNIGSFRTMLGLTSTDEQYSFIERFGGLSEKEVNNMFSNFTNKVEEFSKFNDTWKAGKFTKNVTDVVNEIKNLTTKLGIENDIGNEFGGWDKLEKELEKLISQTKTSSEQGFKNIGYTLGGGALLGGTSFARSGNLALTLASAISGAVVGTITAISETNTQEKLNKQSIEKSKELYLNLVNTLITYSQQKRKDKLNKF